MHEWRSPIVSGLCHGTVCKKMWVATWIDQGMDILTLPSEESLMAEYIPSPREWVRDQVDLYERSGGTEGTTLRYTGLPVIIVTHTGNKTWRSPQDPADARQGRRQLRPRRVHGWSANEPGLGAQPAP